MESRDVFLVQDGAVDSKNRPADRTRTGGWKACYFILANEITERIAFFGILSNIITYMTIVLHEGIAPSATNVSNWIGTTYMITPLGGFLADAFWGRYFTIIITGVVYFMGLLMLTLSASLNYLKPPACEEGSSCPSPTQGQVAFFFFALYMVALGSGCMKPCVSSFGADQFDEMNPTEYKRKNSFFNWWFWGIHVGNILAVTLLVYVQDNVGWGWGFGIPTALLAVSILIFVLGGPYYRYRRPQGSVLTIIFRVLFSALSKWNIHVPPGEQTSFLDRAAMTPEDGKLGQEVPVPWNLCTPAEVEETRIMMKILPMWFSTLLFSTVVSQNPTFFVKQGNTLDNRFGSFKIPPASMQLFTNVTVLLSIPLYDRFFVPAVRKFTKYPRGITMLQRMGTGMFITLATMVVAGLVECKRLKLAHEHPLLKHLPMSIFWLMPQYVLLGLAEACTYAGQLEFFYDQAPESMRTLGASLQLTNLGAGCFLSSILIAAANKFSTHRGGPWIPQRINEGHLQYFYWLLGALVGANILLFIPLARWYKYKENTDGPSALL